MQILVLVISSLNRWERLTKAGTYFWIAANMAACPTAVTCAQQNVRKFLELIIKLKYA